MLRRAHSIWKESFRYIDNTFQLLKTYHYEGEGWGLTTNNKGELIMSNGTNILQFFSPTFTLLREIRVNFHGRVVDNINALSYYNGMIYANIWYSNDIFIINEDTGDVIYYLDLSSIVTDNNEGVLNGITFINNYMLISGKNWKRIYYIIIS